MEIGDLIYVIILVLFMILGFFNDSKKKRIQQQQEMDADSEMSPPHQSIPPIPKHHENSVEKERVKDQFDREKWLKQKHEKGGKVVFQSSTGLLTNFAKESSIQNSLSKYGTDSLYRQDFESANIYEIDSESQELSEVEEKKTFVIHPLVEALTGNSRKHEIVKGIIYGELLKRKY